MRRRKLLTTAATAVTGYSLIQYPFSEMAWAQVPTKYSAGAIANPTILRGVVRFDGRMPKPIMKQVTSDQQVAGKAPRVWEGLSLGKKNTLSSAIVVVEGLQVGKPFKEGRRYAYAKGADIQLRTDVFGLDAPEVVFEVENHDPVLHSWLVKSGTKTVGNIAQPPSPKPQQIKIKTPGLYELNCGPHPWERGFRMAVPHPYYARTDENGVFEISELPAGSYKLSVWAEGLLPFSMSVESKKDSASIEVVAKEENLTAALKKNV